MHPSTAVFHIHHAFVLKVRPQDRSACCGSTILRHLQGPEPSRTNSFRAQRSDRPWRDPTRPLASRILCTPIVRKLELIRIVARRAPAVNTHTPAPDGRPYGKQSARLWCRRLPETPSHSRLGPERIRVPKPTTIGPPNPDGTYMKHSLLRSCKPRFSSRTIRGVYCFLVTHPYTL